MIETTLRTYLLNQLDDIPVYLEKPATKPDTYVLLNRIDGGMIDQISAATFSVVCIAPSMYEAAALAKEVKALLFSSVSEESISSAKLGGETGSADSKERGYQYELIFNFYYYEED